MTRADKIRKMTDDELVVTLHTAYTDGMCDTIRCMNDINSHVNTISYYKQLLQLEATDDGN